MNQLNNIILEGKVISSPMPVAQASNGNKLFKFTIKNERYYRDINGETKDESMFIAIRCWGDIGEKVHLNICKGMIVRVVGRLTMERWETKEGEKRTSVEILATHIEYRNSNKKTVTVTDETDEAC